MTDPHQAMLDKICAHARETAILESAQQLLEWDERTYLPPEAGEYRAEQVAYLAGLIHQRHTDPRLGDWLAELAESPLAADPHSEAGCTIRQMRREYEKKTKLPESLVKELTRLSVRGQQVWVLARKNNDFAAFAPILTQTVSLKRQEADALGYEDCRYDALLDFYEPDEKTATIRRVLAALRDDLAPLVQAIADSGRTAPVSILERIYPVAAQEALGKEAAARIGFEFPRGRLDVTHHPFCTSLGPHDTRITTRYDERFFPSGFFSILHEAGHGVYDQGLPSEQFGLPPGRYVSLGIHESQSRMWENMVGRSRVFWEFLFPAAKQAFPDALDGVPLDQFYFAVNDVRPSLIRVEADEATYNLHIIIRFELEQDLLDDNLSVSDLPGAWSDKYRQYLGIEPPHDADGVLQDVHWSAGLMGYFPTYSLGNLYAAQLFRQADADLGGLEKKFARGEFLLLREWLRDKIHAHGQRYAAGELVERITGKPLDHKPLTDYLRDKLTPLYELA
ncbi:MAG: carboxypeptidase M32 [Planctomycetes bacterium]|nr:carboxypeptidase M32 [Planctomycetota bacterium]